MVILETPQVVAAQVQLERVVMLETMVQNGEENLRVMQVIQSSEIDIM